MKTTTHNAIALAAIIAKYTPATNSRGSRIIVKSQRGRKSYPYPYALSGQDVFCHAVSLYLADILKADRKEYGKETTGWGDISGYSVGILPSEEYVFVRN